jgi:glycosyltransferase involved in cell wall biosynthesis
MTKTISISVALCTYNGEKYLREQLASIAQQTRLPDQLVICDDGSSDATAEIIEEFARTVSFPVRCARNPQNLGSTKNFEKAISLCTGDLIALCDQDDIWLPEKLALQAEMMERDPALGGLFSDAELIDATSALLGKRLWQNIEFTPARQQQFREGHETEVFLRKMAVTGATMMIRANLRSLFTPIPAIWVHDSWIAWMLAIYSKLELMQEPTIQYRLHASQQIGVESLLSTRTLPLRKRLEHDKREEPGQILSQAQQFEELERHLTAAGGIKDPTLLRRLRRRIDFYKFRANISTNKLQRTIRILRNARNYQAYEHGLKGLVRDIVIVFL